LRILSGSKPATPISKELIRQRQHHTNALKANVVLKKQFAAMAQKPAKRR
jgi:hypothetical protein